ncbi:ACP S-malonyltransferase [Fretibacter rubidus]|uniref:ACP S-malonyltransferase n=1 Tax=Fretibacter rubidus TaxID=570162 RepID=UPI00352A0BC3
MGHKKQTAVIICPGRGTYNADEIGYLSRYHSDKAAFIDMIDRVRADAGQEAISKLDAMAKFSPSTHGTGDNASLLIYACALADYFSINRDLYDIVGVTGNSMGWYLSLAVSGAISLEDGARLVNGMGRIMTEHGQGGQVVYSVVDDDWRPDRSKQKHVDDALSMIGDVSIETSIHLGGMHVFAGGDRGIKHLLSSLPRGGNFPFQLRGHSAFHSSKLDHIIPMAQDTFSRDLFKSPRFPMIDGQGNIWALHSTDIDALYNYTLGAQINSTYDFSRAVQNAAHEFAPDVFIVLGPGGTMGAPVAQSLIAKNWRGLSGKTDFQNRQKDAPIILSMGREENRNLVITS